MNGPEIEFDWDEANIAHIAKHDVKPHEAEEVITRNPLDLDYVLRNGEGRFVQVGETLDRRVLVVVSTLRDDKIRVVSARPANRKHRLPYQRMMEQQNDREESSS